MEQTRVKAGYIAGFKIYKECEIDALDMCMRQKKIKFILEHIFSSGLFVFLQSSIKHTFLFITYFQAKKIIVNSM